LPHLQTLGMQALAPALDEGFPAERGRTAAVAVRRLRIAVLRDGGAPEPFLVRALRTVREFRSAADPGGACIRVFFEGRAGFAHACVPLRPLPAQLLLDAADTAVARENGDDLGGLNHPQAISAGGFSAPASARLITADRPCQNMICCAGEKLSARGVTPWRYRLKVRTWPSQGQNPGSSPGIATTYSSSPGFFACGGSAKIPVRFPACRE
jgi:hypothetical protein